MTHASVFSGIGGAEVAATMLGWRQLFHCEINPFGRQVLDYWYPNSKSYEDITTTDFTEWRGRVDVLTGGFPCQPFSYAGRRRGAEDDRYLWPSMYRAIDEIQPTWVVAENVAGILTMVEQGEVSKVAGSATLFDAFDDLRGRFELRETFTLQRICSDLESHGYAVQPVLVPACAVGAPHRRDRVFIVARRVEAVSEDTMHGGQLHRPNEEQGSERHERHTCAGGGERICGEASRTTSADTACGREGTPRPSGEVESSWSHPHQQPSERRAATEWTDRFYAILRPSADPRSCGQSASELESERERTEVQQQGGEQSQHGACGQSNARHATDTDREGLERPAGLRVQGHEGRGQSDGIRECPWDCGEGISGTGRWLTFPSVSPVHRGNDGLPFDVDRLTLSFGKWRTEALKAYGDAIVPQVMYEIFRAIEIVEQTSE